MEKKDLIEALADSKYRERFLNVMEDYASRKLFGWWHSKGEYPANEAYKKIKKGYSFRLFCYDGIGYEGHVEPDYLKYFTMMVRKDLTKEFKKRGFDRFMEDVNLPSLRERDTLAAYMMFFDPFQLMKGKKMDWSSNEGKNIERAHNALVKDILKMMMERKMEAQGIKAVFREYREMLPELAKQYALYADSFYDYKIDETEYEKYKEKLENYKKWKEEVLRKFEELIEVRKEMRSTYWNFLGHPREVIDNRSGLLTKKEQLVYGSVIFMQVLADNLRQDFGPMFEKLRDGLKGFASFIRNKLSGWFMEKRVEERGGLKEKIGNMVKNYEKTQVQRRRDWLVKKTWKEGEMKVVKKRERKREGLVRI